MRRYIRILSLCLRVRGAALSLAVHISNPEQNNSDETAEQKLKL